MTQTFSDQDRHVVDAIVADQLTVTGTPAVIAGVWLPDRGAYVQTYGVGNRETGDPPTVDDHFRIASITKTFVATVLLQLADDGALALDVPIGQFDLDFPHSAAATLADLLGMTSGIFDYTHDDAFAAKYNADPLLPFTPDDALAIARRFPPLFAPGTDISYCDTNTVIAGKIAELATGISIEQLLRDRILSPLGLRETSFPTEPDMPEPVLRGYSQPEATAPIRDVTRSNPDVAWTAGAMISTVQDLYVWARALASGSLLSGAMQEKRLQTRPLTPDQSVRYGLGIANISGFLGHNGGIAGYSLMMLHDPSVDATVITAANLSGLHGGAADPIALQIIQRFFPERFPKT
ncbi:MAG TPA: serine hydrolase domain-containing protein [Thermomicrobiales bacterium]|nr:serine hydrolase domain-containing protein [Thermomicrobiales bacterium]